MKSLNDYKNVAFSTAKKSGFHDTPRDIGLLLMLIVTELSECLEAYRKDKSISQQELNMLYEIKDDEEFMLAVERYLRGTFQEEIADTILRLFDFSAEYNIDLDKIVQIKNRYNGMRERLHGKKF